MTAPTASAILKDLDRRAQSRQMETLAQMDSEHTAAVRAALSGVPRKSKIDVRLLLETVKREIAEAAARRPPADPAVYERDLIAQGYQPYYMSAAALAVAGDTEPDDFDFDDDEALDDDEPAKPRRRSLPRLRSRRLVSKPTRKSRPKAKPEPVFVGGVAAFDDYGRIGPEPGYVPLRPPWLLDDGDDDPDETEEGESQCLQPI